VHRLKRVIHRFALSYYLQKSTVKRLSSTKTISLSAISKYHKNLPPRPQIKSHICHVGRWKTFDVHVLGLPVHASSFPSHNTTVFKWHRVTVLHCIVWKHKIRGRSPLKLKTLTVFDNVTRFYCAVRFTMTHKLVNRVKKILVLLIAIHVVEKKNSV